MPDLPTDEHLDVAWREPRPVPAGQALHLVCAWWLGDPERTGQVGSLARAAYLGRGARRAGEGEPSELCIQRPGKLQLAAPIESTKISSRQLRFQQREDGTVAVECTGRRKLLHQHGRRQPWRRSFAASRLSVLLGVI